MFTTSCDIRPVECTPSRVSYRLVLADFLELISQDEDVLNETVIARGAYNTRCYHSAKIAHGAMAIISTQMNSRP